MANQNTVRRGRTCLICFTFLLLTPLAGQPGRTHVRASTPQDPPATQGAAASPKPHDAPAALDSDPEPTSVAKPPQAAASERLGLEADKFDDQVRAQDDLYRYVNGRWLETTEIPSDKSDYGSFTALTDLSRDRIRTIVDQLSTSRLPKGDDGQKIGDFYRSYMDVERIEQRGLEPLAETLNQIDRIQTHEDLMRFFGRAQSMDVMVPIGFYVSQDAKNSTRYLAIITQYGISLPDRDYYLTSDTEIDAASNALRDYIEKISDLAERGDGKQRSQAVLDIETKLAKAMWPRVKLRDANARYNLFKRADWESETPGLTWRVFFEEAGVPDLDELNVMTPSYFQTLATIFQETPVQAWKEYLTFHALDGAAPYLSEDLVQAHFAFHGTALGGAPEIKPRWERAINKLGAQRFGVLGDALGKKYVQKHFQPKAKQRMDQLVQNLLKAYESSIENLPWMTEATRGQAKEKLLKINTKIGYPRKWRDYSQLTIDPEDLLGNIHRSNQVEYQRMLDKLGQPVDREEWGMTPQTVNAYYSPMKNEIVFPAAILQPPFFDLNIDDAVNYGAIGAVIGHEISHAFDDQGSKYDGDGNLRNWWTPHDRDAFEKITRRLVKQYNQYAPLEGRTVNGQLTLGENIADLSGLSIAYKAYELSLDGKEAPEIDGWTGPQRFFLGWSQAWRRKYRDNEMIRRLMTDPHAPSWYRANGPVVNIDAFYEAFHVKPGDAMFKPKDQRITIW